ncbi:hypothetical protein [Telluria beijingensis]|uniref:hypothetical protein n=1 Tax=Telluria beijingensis TaxID=3068633 RepID=UPI0027960825|nr:hypothetical protein [Massilia sp. REN29]
MSTLTFDAAGITGVREASSVKLAPVQPRAPRLTPMRDAQDAADAPRTRTVLGVGSAVSYECAGWMRWTGA